MVDCRLGRLLLSSTKTTSALQPPGKNNHSQQQLEDGDHPLNPPFASSRGTFNNHDDVPLVRLSREALSLPFLMELLLVLAYWTGLLFFFLVCTLRLLSSSYSY